MLSQGNLAGWLLVAGYVALVVGGPLLIGAISRTTQRATVFSALCGVLGAAALVAGAVYLRGTRGLLPTQIALFLFAASAAAAATAGWLTHRIAGFFHAEAPLAAAWKTVRFLGLTVLRAALIYCVLNAVWILAAIDLADEIPQIMFLRVEWYHYLYIGTGIVIGVTWIVRYTRGGHQPDALRNVVLQELAGAVIVLLFLPIVMATFKLVGRSRSWIARDWAFRVMSPI